MQLRYCMIFLVGFTLGGLLVYIADDTIIPNYNFVQKTPLHLELTTTSATTPKVSENVITKPYEEPSRKIIYEPFDPNHNRSVHIQLVSDRDKIAFWKEYAQYHDEMFKRDKKRFILWTKSVGWGLGNNINGLITTILLSLLTDRAFLADDSYVTEKLVDWPIAWQWHKVKDRLPEMPSTPIYFQNADCFFSNAGSKGSETQYKDLEEMFPGDMIRMETNCPAFHWMSQNEKYIPKLRKLGMIPDGMPTIYNSFYVATWISNVFLKTTINSTVQDSLNKFIADHHFRDSYVIGVQLRFGNDGTSFIQAHEINGALKCAVDLASGKENVHLFIASNSETAYQAFSYTFGSENVSYVPGAVQSFDMQTVTDGMLKIFLDNFLLSEADELIVTPMSTFGSVAAFRGGILPMVVKGEGCYPAKMEAGPGGNPPTWDTLLLW